MSFMQTIKCADTAVQPVPELELAMGNYCDSGIILYFLFGLSFGLEPKIRQVKTQASRTFIVHICDHHQLVFFCHFTTFLPVFGYLEGEPIIIYLSLF